ncbi:MFS family permease [Pseudomonas syringae pv. actinidiae]|uniref:MFS family permease n=1 Tax=Pseudomonas syringae pv. actinidiae TaxID=103796 RepID=A0A2V0QAQ0_PSESF|nr:MFS family permease [Pseudomonas syringae pv. actinidiae]
MVDLILDIVAPVTGGLRTNVRNLIISTFKYDIDSKEMIG